MVDGSRVVTLITFKTIFEQCGYKNPFPPRYDVFVLVCIKVKEEQYTLHADDHPHPHHGNNEY